MQVGDRDAFVLLAYGVPWHKIKDLSFEGGRKAVTFYRQKEQEGAVHSYAYPPASGASPRLLLCWKPVLIQTLPVIQLHNHHLLLLPLCLAPPHQA